jgi:hypothetical protein
MSVLDEVQSVCKHPNLDDDFEVSVVEYCPKGCDGDVLIDGTVYCMNCNLVIYEVHRGHEDCKYGR